MSFITSDLPYAYNALEPWIDEETMKLHHDKHHVTYTTNLNTVIDGSAYASWSLEDLLTKLSDLPESIRTVVRNHGGGHYNHELFWKVMAPAAGQEPEGLLFKAIERDLGSYKQFTDSFTQAAVKRFGSGWAWLVSDKKGIVSITSSANQDTPLTEGLVPLLGLDVWEHAYYLKYRNRRAEYIENFYKIINWKEVGKSYLKALET